MNSLYHLPISESLKSAWNRVHGSKGSFWAAIAIIFVVALLLQILIAIAHSLSPGFASVVSFISDLVLVLLQMGLLYMGIQRAFDLPISYQQLWRAFDFDIMIRVLGLYLIKILLAIPAVILFMTPLFFNKEILNQSDKLIVAAAYIIGIIYIVYLFTRLILSWGFIVDKVVNPIQAIKLSWRATRDNFWRILITLIISSLIILVSMIPFFIGLIWTLPFATILYGVIYRSLIINSQ